MTRNLFTSVAAAAVLVVEAVLVLAALGTGVLLALRLTGPGVGGCRLVAAVLGLRVAGLGAVLACGARAGATGTALPAGLAVGLLGCVRPDIALGVGTCRGGLDGGLRGLLGRRARSHRSGGP